MSPIIKGAIQTALHVHTQCVTLQIFQVQNNDNYDDDSKTELSKLDFTLRENLSVTLWVRIHHQDRGVLDNTW